MTPPLQKQIPSAILAGAIFVSGCLPGCSPPGYKEQNIPISAETFKTYPALLSVDRSKMGFPPLPTTGAVRILIVDREHWALEYPPPNYDVSFQFYEGSDYPRIARFVALKRADDGYQWVSEQVTFTGPKIFISDESEKNERIAITAETEQVTHIGANIQGTMISYEGPDKRLAKSRQSADNLTVSQIGPILREWGYDYSEDKVQQTGAVNGSQPLQPAANQKPSATAPSR